MPIPAPSHEITPERTAGWWTILLSAPVVGLATVIGWQCVDLVRAEQLLAKAAHAAATEATLPKATVNSVSMAAERALKNTQLDRAADQPIILVNGVPVLLHPLERLQSGDRVAVTLGAYAVDVVPDLLQPLGLSLSGRKLRADSTVIKP